MPVKSSRFSVTKTGLQCRVFQSYARHMAGLRERESTTPVVCCCWACLRSWITLHTEVEFELDNESSSDETSEVIFMVRLARVPGVGWASGMCQNQQDCQLTSSSFLLRQKSIWRTPVSLGFTWFKRVKDVNCDARQPAQQSSSLACCIKNSAYLKLQVQQTFLPPYLLQLT